jgi:hypothetical protein
LAARDSQDIRLEIVTDTDRLVGYMHTHGDCWLFEVPVDDEMKHAAVLTITIEERGNLEQFGDVVFLDGTAVPNPLGWTTYPITLVDDTKGLMSGGLLFTAYEREEMFLWLLTHLNDILGPVLRTIVTNEDSAIIPAMVNFRDSQRPDVAHRICVFHKKAISQNA